MVTPRKRPSWVRLLAAAAVGSLAVSIFMRLSPEKWQDRRYYQANRAREVLQGFAAAEETYRGTNGHYGRLGDLTRARLVASDAIIPPGYTIELEPAGEDRSRFWAEAWPMDTADRVGRCFFVNQTAVLYTGDDMAHVDSSCAVPPGYSAR